MSDTTPGVAVQRCARCNTRYFPARAICAVCGAMEWVEDIALDGTVEFTTLVRKRVGTAQAEPVSVLLIKTDLGPSLVARGEGECRPGDRVTLFSEGTTPVARPV